MFELVLLLAQLAIVSALAAWLTLGVWDNIFHPANNEAITAQVMGMTRMRETFPEEFTRVAHRAVTSRATQRAAFRLVVLVELVATLALWLAAITLLLSAFGGAERETGSALAMLGATLFTCIWAGFLIVGNYFCYWFCHEWGQNTHYQMTIWGTGAMVFLLLAHQTLS